MNAGDYARQIAEAGDNYKLTVLALKAFANEMLFDDVARRPIPGATVHSGRRMTTSRVNRHSPNADVTPDLVLRHIPGVAVVAEAKLGFPRDAAEFARRADESAQQIE